MTLYLENTSNKKTITLRYGSGNNNMLQINPQEKQILPSIITKHKLQTYLHLFKDLKLVEDEQIDEKVEDEKVEDEQIDEKVEDEQIDEKVEDEKVEDGKVEDEKVEDEKVNEDNGGVDGKTRNENEQITGNGNEGQSDPQSSGDSEKDNNPDGKTENREKTIYSEKVLNGLKAAIVKDIAISLGIEVTEESTKKALIPVILNKQGN